MSSESRSDSPEVDSSVYYLLEYSINRKIFCAGTRPARESVTTRQQVSRKEDKRSKQELHFFGSPNSVPFPIFFIGTLQNTELKNGRFHSLQTIIIWASSLLLARATELARTKEPSHGLPTMFRAQRSATSLLN
jgi:hypothetical protein